MNNSTHEEFEEVESPFLKSKPKASKLRSKKSHFNRPFAADPTIAPAVFDTRTSKNDGFQEQMDFDDVRKNDFSETKIDYLEDDAESQNYVEQKTPRLPKKQLASSKKKSLPSSKFVTLPKLGWLVISILSLRLIFMDRGVWDYFVSESNLDQMKVELKNLQNENRDLVTEIGKIKFDKSYQKFLAKEHLGVIAGNEFLVLFAGEESEISESIKTN